MCLWSYSAHNLKQRNKLQKDTAHIYHCKSGFLTTGNKTKQRQVMSTLIKPAPFLWLLHHFFCALVTGFTLFVVAWLHHCGLCYNLHHLCAKKKKKLWNKCVTYYTILSTNTLKWYSPLIWANKYLRTEQTAAMLHFSCLFSIPPPLMAHSRSFLRSLQRTSNPVSIRQVLSNHF